MPPSLPTPKFVVPRDAPPTPFPSGCSSPISISNVNKTISTPLLRKPTRPLKNSTARVSPINATQDPNSLRNDEDLKDNVSDVNFENSACNSTLINADLLLYVRKKRQSKKKLIQNYNIF